jgi:hypothetical protein
VETNAAFVHRKWAAIYEAQLPRRALKLASALPHCQAGLEKTRVFYLKKKPSPVGFLSFFGFFGVFLFFCFFCFFLFFFNICPEERVFRVFSVSRILLGASRL